MDNINYYGSNMKSKILYPKFQDEKLMEEVVNIIKKDTYLLSPELDDREEIPHTAIRGTCNNTVPFRDVNFPCNIATRYFDDDSKYIRAYALSPYNSGIAIFANKKFDDITIFVLGEDDGSWFISSGYGLEWIHHKSQFIYLVIEAINIFNANYKEQL